jgi:1-acyl-sn-glycerol-3-phosphate acyltransferase
MRHTGFFYTIFRPLVKFALVIFYRRIQFNGEENFPVNESYIIAPNHQNAFMDALVISCFTKRPIHFLVRADVFNNKIAARVFKSFNMMPIFRERDGRHNMHKNEIIFEKCIHLLSNGEVLMIFPEASHFGKRFLRPLRKGIARIGFDSVEQHNHLSDLKIIPVGINYSDYFTSNSDLLLNIGKPFYVKEFYQILEENKLAATTGILDNLHNKIKSELLHIESDILHSITEKLYLRFVFYFKEPNIFGVTPRENYLYFKNKFIPKFDHASQEFELKKIEEYFSAMEQYKLEYPIYYLKKKFGLNRIASILGMILLIPIFVLSYLSVVFPISLINSSIKSKVKDPQFISSFKITAGIFLFIISAFLIALSIFLISRNIFISVVFFFFYPFLIIFYQKYLRQLKKMKSVSKAINLDENQLSSIESIENEVVEILTIK